MDDLSEALANLKEVLLSLPGTLSEVLKAGFQGTQPQSVIPTGKIAATGTIGNSLRLAEFSTEAKKLTEIFHQFRGTIRLIMDSLGVNKLTPTPLQSSPSVEAKQVAQEPASEAAKNKPIQINIPEILLPENLTKALSQIPNAFQRTGLAIVGALGGWQIASLPRVYHRLFTLGANFPYIPGSAVKAGKLFGGAVAIDLLFENLRRQALAANAANEPLSLYSGPLYHEQAVFRLGQFQRLRTLAHATSGTGGLLAQRVNLMEESFLPFDILRKNFQNNVGIIKANLAKSFADVILTPIVNVINGAGNLFNAGVDSNIPGVPAATLFTTLLSGYGLGKLLLGARFGGPIGLATAALWAAPNASSSLLSDIGTFALAGAAFGMRWGLPGIIGGGAIAGVAGAAWHAFKPDEQAKIRNGPWMDFIKKAANQKPLRPPVKVAQIPNRFQRVR